MAMAVEHSGTSAAVSLVEIMVAVAIRAIATFMHIGLSMLCTESGRNCLCVNQRHKHCTITARRLEEHRWLRNDTTTLNIGFVSNFLVPLPFGEEISIPRTFSRIN